MLLVAKVGGGIIAEVGRGLGRAVERVSLDGGVRRGVAGAVAFDRARGGRGEVGLSIVLLHQADGPFAEVDGSALRSLEEGILVLRSERG